MDNDTDSGVWFLDTMKDTLSNHIKKTDGVNTSMDQLSEALGRYSNTESAHPLLKRFVGLGIVQVINSSGLRTTQYLCEQALLLGFIEKINELESRIFDLEHEAIEDKYDG